ncbi:MAG: DoxX family membrane protein [Deltaproteobacteria bacterium]|nr:DoxX family membrane protein [Deltaproteobacteria bacterium]
MKFTVIAVRVLLGALYVFASAAFLFDLITPPPPTGNVKTFMEGVLATGYLMNFVKVTELVCGIALVAGYFVPLAAVILAPISLNIFLFHLYVDPQGLAVGIFVVLANLFLGYAYRDRFRPMLQPK